MLSLGLEKDRSDRVNQVNGRSTRFSSDNHLSLEPSGHPPVVGGGHVNDELCLDLGYTLAWPTVSPVDGRLA